MRIAIIGQFPKNRDAYLNEAGVPTYLYNFVWGLSQHHGKDAKIDVLTLRREKNAAPPSPEEFPFSATVKPCFRKGILSFLKLWFIVAFRRYEIVHIHHETFLYGGPLSLLVFPLFVFSLRMVTKPVVTLHHVIDRETITEGFSHKHYSHIPTAFIRWGYQWFFSITGKAASLLIVHEPYFRDTLVQDYAVRPEKIECIPHGIIDPQLSATGTREELLRYFGIPEGTKTVFGYLGFISGYKGIDYLVEEYASHAAREPSSVLLLCGGLHPHYEHSASYRTYIEQLKKRIAESNGRAIWHGFLEGKDVERFFSVVDGLVLPYSAHFSSSGPLALAMAYEKPVLISDLLHETVPDAPHFRLEKEELAQTLDSFYRESQEERERGIRVVAALKRARAWPIIGDITFEAYSRLLLGKRRILLLGAYGQENLGDDVLLSTCLSFLPQDACIVASAQPKKTSEKYGVASIPSQKGILRKLWTFLRARTVVIGGGDQFKILKKTVGRFRSTLVVQFFAIALLSRVMRKQLYFIGIGIGNLPSPFARLLMGWCLRLATSVTVRDKNSFALLSRQSPKTHGALSADLAFLSLPPTKRGQESPSPTLGIAPVFNIDHAEAFPLIVRELGKATDGFLKDPARRAVFLPFQTGFNPHNDILVSEEILAGSQQRDHCRIARDLGDENVQETYRSLDFLWGMRLHSLIFACLHAVPFLALIYDIKVWNFLEEINCTEWGIPLDGTFTSEHLLSLHRRLEERAADVRRHLRSQAERLHQQAEINADLLRGIAQGTPAVLPPLSRDRGVRAPSFRTSES